MSQPSEPHREGDASDAMLDELLRAAAAQPAPLPPGLIENVERFIASRCRRRRRRRALVGLAAAAAVALLVSSWLARRSLDPTAPDVPSPRRAPIAAQAASAPVAEVDVSTGPGTIAVPVRSGNPRVTVYWVYTAVGPQQPKQR